MNCRDFSKYYVELLDGEADTPRRAELVAHLHSCQTCAQLYDETRRTLAQLQPSQRIAASSHLKERIMNTIAEIEKNGYRESEARKTVRINLWKPALVVATVALILAALTVFNWFRQSKGQAPLSAFTVLAQAEEAISHLRSVHIQARMRTLPADNFELIGEKYDFVPHEMWKEFSDPPRWRVEKPGRVVVMDGKSALLWIKPSEIAQGSPTAGFVGWLRPLLDPQAILDSEKRLAQQQGSQISITREEGDDGATKLVLTVEAKAQGDFANDWCKNRTIVESDNRRVYRFDAQSNLLEGLQVYVHAKEGDVLVFEVTKIEYDTAIDPSLFSLDLPKDVVSFKLPEPLPDNERYQNMAPEEAARAFFQACADENWEEVLKFYPVSSLNQDFKDYLGGLQIISIGKPFKSGRYGGWFVPYEIKLKSGDTKKFNLAIRNDNPAKRWMVDGGI
jgi:type II secretory pathway pseudopilin PulG